MREAPPFFQPAWAGGFAAAPRPELPQWCLSVGAGRGGAGGDAPLNTQQARVALLRASRLPEIVAVLRRMSDTAPLRQGIAAVEAYHTDPTAAKLRAIPDLDVSLQERVEQLLPPPITVSMLHNWGPPTQIGVSVSPAPHPPASRAAAVRNGAGPPVAASSESPGELTAAIDRMRLPAQAKAKVRALVQAEVQRHRRPWVPWVVLSGIFALAGGVAVYHGLAAAEDEDAAALQTSAAHRPAPNDDTTETPHRRRKPLVGVDLSPLRRAVQNRQDIEAKLRALQAVLAKIPAPPTTGALVSAQEVRGRMMQTARVYALFTQAREAAMQRGALLQPAELETVLDTSGEADVRLRHAFYTLARDYFARVEAMQQKVAAIVGQGNTAPGTIADAARLKSAVRQRFGFIPDGKVELVVRDVHLSWIFYQEADYVRATEPQSALWSKVRKDYTAEEARRYQAIRNYALRTGGMSFGDGTTIVRDFGAKENQATVIHEEGHELDSVGPYFWAPVSAWSALGWNVAADAATELQALDTFLEQVFDKNGVRSLHTEMLQYLREGNRLRIENPFRRGGLYDPLPLYDLKSYLQGRYAAQPKLLKSALKTLAAKHAAFYARVDRTYACLSRLDRDFHAHPTFAQRFKPLILGYLATRGTAPWDLDLLGDVSPAQK
ncbi:MAG: hypothetical protein HY696_00840 [Deltaproteobacteria bacterium]|nr:hypothetical protein [Deltaproteobacteria bacterium]